MYFLIFLLSVHLSQARHSTNENSERPKVSNVSGQECAFSETDPELTTDESGQSIRRPLPGKTKYSLKEVARSMVLKVAAPSLTKSFQWIPKDKFMFEIETKLNNPEFWEKAFPLIPREQLENQKKEEFNSIKRQIEAQRIKINKTALQLEKEYGGPFKEIASLSSHQEESSSFNISSYIQNYSPSEKDELFFKKISVPFTRIASIEKTRKEWIKKKESLEDEISSLRKKRNELDYVYPRSNEQEEELESAKKRIEELVGEIGDYKESISALVSARPSRDVFTKDSEVQKFVANNQTYLKGWDAILEALENWKSIEEQNALTSPLSVDNYLAQSKEDLIPKKAAPALMINNLKKLNLGYVAQFRKMKNGTYEFLSLSPIQGERKQGKNKLITLSIVEEGSEEDESDKNRGRKMRADATLTFSPGFEIAANGFLLCDAWSESK